MDVKVGRLDEFKDYLLNKEKSINTIESYASDINQFINYLNNSKIYDIDDIVIREYKNYLLNDKNLHPKSVNRKIIAIRQYLQLYNIKTDVKLEKIQEQDFLEDLIDNNEINCMIAECENAKDFRAKALILTLFYTGMRISEALQVKITDVGKDSIRILGKGKKYRNVLIPKKLQVVWSEYINQRINKTEYLFTGREGNICRRTALRILKKYGKLANIDLDKVYNHNFRHVFCLNLVKKNVSIDVVKKLAGHESVKTTLIYTQRTKSELLDIINDL